MKMSTDEITEMFAEVMGLSSDDKPSAEQQDTQWYNTCPYLCASRGQEDWWC